MVFERLLLCLMLFLGMPLLQASHREGELYAKLLEEYEPLERPVANSSEPVNVKMGLVLQQIISVDEKNQLVDVNAWLKLSWHDYSLEWDPKDYEGVADLRFKKAQLWTPDVLLYNSADPQFDSSFQSNVVVYPDGTINWIPPGIFRISCRIAVAWFPFDVQECFLKFGSWTFDGSKLNLDVDENGFDLSSYIQNGEWELTATSAVQNIQHYQCCPEPYYDVVFTFVIRRRVLYYAFNLILPCILITMLTLIGFTLPPDAGEKMSLRKFPGSCTSYVGRSTRSTFNGPAWYVGAVAQSPYRFELIALRSAIGVNLRTGRHGREWVGWCRDRGKMRPVVCDTNHGNLRDSRCSQHPESTGLSIASLFEMRFGELDILQEAHRAAKDKTQTRQMTSSRAVEHAFSEGRSIIITAKFNERSAMKGALTTVYIDSDFSKDIKRFCRIQKEMAKGFSGYLIEERSIAVIKKTVHGKNNFIYLFNTLFKTA
ncbi:Cation transporter family protein [Teladorsagia circumcincta]|uniref:Cation transporter family protein n=1 Tax=Teladorsagia circumcincta TaxID=45464 RepID=A0A2G9TR83_TELCI|nr:Cation transporter family protein [Teladorsagia circumcincta]